MLLTRPLYFCWSHSYCVRRTLMQYIKLSNSDKIVNLHINHAVLKKLSTKSTPKGNVMTAVDESYDHYIKVRARTRSKSTKPKIADEMVTYFLSKSPVEAVNEIPNRLLRRNKLRNENIYLADQEAADLITNNIKGFVAKRGCIVVEANPGVALLSKKLIEAGVEELHLYEPSASFFKYLKEFKNEHQNIVSLHSNDFLAIWKLAFQDKIDNGNRVENILRYYPKQNWSDDPSLKIIGTIQTTHFIKHLIRNLVNQNGILAHCRPELYLLMPPSVHLHLTCTGQEGYMRYRTTSVIFQLWFDYELLEKIPRKAFVPWYMSRSVKTKKLEEVDMLNAEWLYLMRIVPKRNLYEEVAPPEKLRALWYFIRHHFWRRSSKLIPEMESWIPGCGIRLIFEGYNIFTEFGELQPHEVLRIFSLFSNWPEFEDCSFISSMENALLKWDATPEESMDKEETEEVNDEQEEREDGDSTINEEKSR